MVRSLLALVVLSTLISLAAQAQTAAATSAPTMAVLPLRAEGLQLNEANRLNLLLRARATSRGGYAVQGQDLTNQLVEASQALGVDCDINAAACGVELGKLADVDFVLIGRGVKLAATAENPACFGIDVQLVDVKAGVGLRRVIGRISADADAQTRDVDDAANALFGNGPQPGLALQVAPEGSTVKLDGVVLGLSPLTPTAGLLVGAHVLDVEKKGFLAQSTPFTIEAGGAAALAIDLLVDPDAEKEVVSPMQKAIPFVTAGVGGVVAMAGGGLMLVGLQPLFASEAATRELAALEAEAETVDDRLFPDKVATANETATRERASWLSWGQPTTVAGGVAIGVGVAAIAAGITWGVVLLNTDVEEP